MGVGHLIAYGRWPFEALIAYGRWPFELIAFGRWPLELIAYGCSAQAAPLEWGYSAASGALLREPCLCERELSRRAGAHS